MSSSGGGDKTVLMSGELKKVASAKGKATPIKQLLKQAETTRFFVLYDDNAQLSSFGRLCYYSSQGKYEQSLKNKKENKRAADLNEKVVDLSQLICVHYKATDRSKFVIVTSDNNCFLLGGDEQDVTAWVDNIILVYNKIRQRKKMEAFELYRIAIKCKLSYQPEDPGTLSPQTEKSHWHTLLQGKQVPCVLAFLHDKFGVFFESTPDRLSALHRNKFFDNLLELEVKSVEKLELSAGVLYMDIARTPQNFSGKLKIQSSVESDLTDVNNFVTQQWKDDREKENSQKEKRLHGLAQIINRIKRHDPSERSTTSAVRNNDSTDVEQENTAAIYKQGSTEGSSNDEGFVVSGTSRSKPLPIPGRKSISRRVSVNEKSDSPSGSVAQSAGSRSRTDSLFKNKRGASFSLSPVNMITTLMRLKSDKKLEMFDDRRDSISSQSGYVGHSPDENGDFQTLNFGDAGSNLSRFRSHTHSGDDDEEAGIELPAREVGKITAAAASSTASSSHFRYNRRPLSKTGQVDFGERRSMSSVPKQSKIKTIDLSDAPFLLDELMVGTEMLCDWYDRNQVPMLQPDAVTSFSRFGGAEMKLQQISSSQLDDEENVDGGGGSVYSSIVYQSAPISTSPAAKACLTSKLSVVVDEAGVAPIAAATKAAGVQDDELLYTEVNYS